MVEIPAGAAAAEARTPRRILALGRRRAAEGGEVGRSRAWDLAAHGVLIAGCAIIVLPLWMAIVASTHPGSVALSEGLPLTPGGELVANYGAALERGIGQLPSVGGLMWNSFIMALGIAVGKIAISVLSAYAIVFFRFPFRMLAFWTIFITLMLPVEVRIFPTVEVVTALDMRNSYWGLTLPILASATATFLFRQFFRTIPDSLVDAGRMDGFGPWGFFTRIVLPLSATNMAALFIIMFIYGWNQYLLPLLVADNPAWYTIVVSLRGMLTDENPQWHIIMAITVLAVLPPALMVVAFQRLVVKGLVEPEK